MFRLLVIAALAALTLAEDSYVVVAPSKFRAGMDFTVSVNVLKATDDVSVNAYIVRTNDNSRVASATATLRQGQPEAVHLQIPADVQSGTYELHVNGSGGLDFANHTQLTYSSKSMSLYVQTDKAMYKPGQTVNFRVFGAYPDLQLYTGNLDIEIYDPNTNKIKQWLAVSGQEGVVTLALPISSQPVEGDWKIKVIAGNSVGEKVFTVAEYVLPKFEVKVQLPSYVLESSASVPVIVTAKYTYGEPVAGPVVVEVKKINSYLVGTQPAVQQTAQLGRDGSVQVDFPMTDLQHLGSPLASSELTFTANVTEALTGNTRSGSASVTVFSQGVKLEFLESNPDSFKPGLDYIGYLKVSQPDGLPVAATAGMSVRVQTTVTAQLEETTTPYLYYMPQTMNYELSPLTLTLPENGLVTVQISVPANATSLSLHAEYDGVSSYTTVSKSYSPSNNYIQLFLRSPDRLQAGGQVNFEVKATESMNTLVYQILSRGSIVSAGSVEANSATSQLFSLPVLPAMAPNARIVIYYVRDDGEIVTDSISFDVDGAFQNQVSIRMDRTEAEPADTVHITVSAAPDSVAHLLAVDQSVLLLKSGNDITTEQVIGELKSFDTIDQTSYPPFDIFPMGGAPVARGKRMVWFPYPTYYGGSDANQIFQNAGVLVMTDALVYQYVQPYYPVYFEMAMGPRPGGVGGGQGQPLQEVERVRSEFPETWLWTNASVGSHFGMDLGGIRFYAMNGIGGSQGQGQGHPLQETTVLCVALWCLVLSWARVGYEVKRWCQTDYKKLNTYAVYFQKLGFGPTSVSDPIYYAMAGAGPGPVFGIGGVGGGQGQPLQEVERVRSEFPETWLWTNASVGADGTATITSIVPDTITSWVASAFSVSSSAGLGVASSTAQLRVFRPFFVSLNLPYSVVRGEQVVLQAIVFNYLQQDTDVLVTLAQSQDFYNLIIDSTGQEDLRHEDQAITIRVAAGEGKSVYFPIVPITLGNMELVVSAQSSMAADGVRRQLLVEAEGVPKEYSVAVLIDLKDRHTFTRSMPLSLPSDVVAGSERARITAIGDLMGPSVSGLDNLLQMPTGCGEQNMIGMAPDVFVTSYLTATHQLTSDIQEKAIGFMEQGYQRELTYQHKDGSFSAFGEQDTSGSMWLTAFVAKTFHQAREYVFIDDQVMARAIEWMVTRQNADGSFPEPGNVIHKDMQGGSSSGPGLTAFVLIALLENNDLQGSISQRVEDAKVKAIGYLQQQLPTMTDDYMLAITSYALTLAHDSSAPAAFATLESHAIVRDGMKHWHRPSTETATHDQYWQPPDQATANDVEMTAYALLTYAAADNFLGGLDVMKWIASQRNPNGGYYSTQDTILALQSLSEFAQLAYSADFDVQVDVRAESFHQTFSINPVNALVLQTVELPSIPNSVSVSATGSGIALVEVAVFFNVEAEVEAPTFEITVSLLQDTMNMLEIEACARWLSTGSSGMAVQEIGIPSGFSVDVESLVGPAQMKRTDLQDRKIVIYLDEIGTAPVCVRMLAHRTGLVAKSQPVAVRVYDYYAPNKQATTFYESTVLKNSSVCDVCENCSCPARRK